MKIKKFLCIVTAMALMLMGSVSIPITAKADGFEIAPCPYCHTGSVWRSEESYKVLLGTRICVDGYTKGTDSHYEIRVLISRECVDCEMLKEYKTEIRQNYWYCEGYNITPGIK